MTSQDDEIGAGSTPHDWRDHVEPDEVMRLLQLLISTEQQVEAGLLVERSLNEYSVVHPDSYHEDLMELAMDKALRLRGMKNRKKQSQQRGRRYD